MKLATPEQMRRIDKIAIDSYAIPSIELMERASQCIVDEIVKRFPNPKTFMVVCGSGNNGGDGLAMANLSDSQGWQGDIWLAEANPAKPSQDFSANFQRARDAGIPIYSAAGQEFEVALQHSDVIIDALLGTGAAGEPRPYIANAIRAINTHAKGAVVSVDIPSGVDPASGAVPTDVIHATLTITLGFSKPGLHLSPGCDYAGELVVRGDFLPVELVDSEAPNLQMMVTKPSDIKSWLPSRDQSRDKNKGTYGAVMILAGSNGFVGAACLAAFGAARTGAGTVTLGVPQGLQDVAMARAPEVVMTLGLPDGGTRQFAPDAVKQVLESSNKTSAMGLGPGISHASDEIQAFVLEMVKQCNKPMGLDADALTIIAALGDIGVDAVRNRNAPTILTPHPGEMARLLGVETSDVQSDRVAAVQRASAKYNCVVLLKGDRTLIAAPDGRLAINETGNPGMASGGMGDVLTGVATTLLAQIDDPFHAATAAAYLHGLAGDIARDEIGIAGILATDVADRIPKAITRCLIG